MHSILQPRLCGVALGVSIGQMLPYILTCGMNRQLQRCQLQRRRELHPVKTKGLRSSRLQQCCTFERNSHGCHLQSDNNGVSTAGAVVI